MKSDHWNFLANLLGTPGPAKSQEEKKTKQPSSDQGEDNTIAGPSPESQVMSEEPPSSGEALKTPSGEEPDVTAEPVTASSPADEAGPSSEPESGKKITREDVLDALTSTTPPKVLPGFGAPEESEEATSLEQLTNSSNSSASPEHETASQAGSNETSSISPPQEDSSSQDKTQVEIVDQTGNSEKNGEDTDDSWGQLAEDIGFTPRESDQPATSPKKSGAAQLSAESVAVDSMTAPVTENQKRKTKQNSPGRSSTKESASGFGAGLGFEIEDDSQGDETDDFEETRQTFGEETSAHESETGERESNPSTTQDSEAELELPGGWATFSDKESEPSVPKNTIVEEPQSSTNPGSSRENEKANQRQSDRRRRYRDDDEDGGVRSKPPRTRGRTNERQQRESGDRKEGEAESLEKDRRSNRQNDEHSGDSRKRRPRGRRGARQRMSEEDIQQLDGVVDQDSGESKDEGDLARSRHDDRRRGGRRRNRDRHEATGDESSRRSQQSDDPELEADSEVEFRSEESGHDDSAPNRGRRRGRRGRGGRRRRGEGVDKDATSQDSDTLQSASAFDDDHEDDHEMEEIRHEQRGGSRNRRRDEDDSDSGGENRRSRRRRATDSDPSEERPNRGRKDRDTENSREPRGKRTTIPSWLDTIDLLVNANIENHKKTKNNRGRGHKKR